MSNAGALFAGVGYRRCVVCLRALYQLANIIGKETEKYHDHEDKIKI